MAGAGTTNDTLNTLKDNKSQGFEAKKNTCVFRSIKETMLNTSSNRYNKGRLDISNKTKNTVNIAGD